MKSIYLPLAVLVTGCASTLEMDSSFVPSTAAEKGVVILSVTSTGQYGSALSGDLRFKCESGASGGLANGHGLARYIDGERLAIPIKADFPLTAERPMGRIHIIQLPAGDCFIDSFSGSASGMASMTTLRSSKTMKIAFGVKPNTTQYIGNFDMNWAPRAGRPSFNDFYERDLAVVRNQNPSLVARPVEKSMGRVLSW